MKLELQGADDELTRQTETSPWGSLTWLMTSSKSFQGVKCLVISAKSLRSLLAHRQDNPLREDWSGVQHRMGNTASVNR